MLSRKSFIFLLSLFGLLFLSSLFIDDVNAWQLTDPFFDSSQNLNIYRSYMEQAEGAPYIVNNEHLGTVGPASSYVLLSGTDSAIQTKTLFGFTTAGYTLSGDDSSQRYHSAQAIFYFNINNSSFISFRNVPIQAEYILYSTSGSVIGQTVDCSLSYNQDVYPPYVINVSIECPQVTYKGTGWSYRWIDLNIGDVFNTTYDFNSDYFVRYRNGGPFRISATVGQYIVSSSDNASELALEQITQQNQTIINQNQQMIDDSQEYYDKTYESVDNISDQTTSDIQGVENQTSSNLINAVVGFTSAISSITVAPDCNITLPFPSYAGGNVPVNLCQHKEKAPEIIFTFGSITLIAVALGFWIRCIISLYKLIRSFIDGIDEGNYIDIEAID